MKLKSKDIAKMLGVSPATVSLVLNNKPGISDDTRNRIIQLLQEHGHDTSRLTADSSSVSKTIQFIVYKKHGKVVSDTPFFSELIESINRTARSEGYNLNITYIDEKVDNIPSILNMIEQSSAAGILILATEMYTQDLKPFQKLNVPILLLDSQFDNQDINTVCINNSDGINKALDYLTDLGHTEIGYLHSNVWIYNFEQRMLRFTQHMADRNLSLPDNNIFHLEPTVEGSYRDMKDLLTSRKDFPTALFADNDIIAFGAMRALKEAGYSIPNDVSIIGFDDTPFCELITPNLTTIRVFKQQMGAIAVSRLIQCIETPNTCIQKTYIGTRLIKRESVRQFN
jgi:DNA-binding LacI/PurR family transcriptional regulator